MMRQNSQHNIYFLTSDVKKLLWNSWKFAWELPSAQWSEGVTKPQWSSEQIEVNLSFLETFVYILSRKVFSNIFQTPKISFKSKKKMLKNKEIW